MRTNPQITQITRITRMKKKEKILTTGHTGSTGKSKDKKPVIRRLHRLHGLEVRTKESGVCMFFPFVVRCMIPDGRLETSAATRRLCVLCVFAVKNICGNLCNLRMSFFGVIRGCFSGDPVSHSAIRARRDLLIICVFA